MKRIFHILNFMTDQSKEQVIKRKAIPMGIEANIEEHSIIVLYEQQTIYGDKEGNQTRIEKKKGSRVIKLGNFTKDDINEIADELIRSCNLINPQRRDILLKALMSLVIGQKCNSLAGDASMEKIDEYIDAMYDDLATKIESTQKIVQLCSEQDNMDEIAGNDVLMASLARSLRDDGQKSMELGTNIAHCFFLISHFQTFGGPLIVHKAPESLFKMIDQECKRYATFYKKIAEMRQQCQKSVDPKLKEAYQQEYDKFKKLITTQDKMLYVALQTIMNLTEITEQQGQSDLFYPIDKLVLVLVQVLSRKPPNPQLILTVINYLKRISIIPNGIDEIRKAKILPPLMKLFENDPDLYDPIIRLLFNLSFDQRVRMELGDLEIYGKLDQFFTEMNNDLFVTYEKEYDANDPIQVKIQKVVKNHANREVTEDIKAIQKRAAVLSKFVYQLFADDFGSKGFEKTNVGQNLTVMACLFKDQDPDIIQTLQAVAQVPQIAQKIVKYNLLGGLTDQFEQTKNQIFMKLFTGIAGAIPQDQRIGKQDATKGSKEGNVTAAQEALYENAAKIADIAITTGDPGLQKQALALIAQAPAQHIKKEQAEKITKMALGALVSDDGDLEKKISAVGVVAMMMSRANHVQLMCDNGDLKKLPDQLLDTLQEAMGKTKLSPGVLGLDFQTAEYDLIIVILVCVLKACTYKVLRREFLSRKTFLPAVVRQLYNIPRKGTDTLGWRAPQTEETKEAEKTEVEKSEATPAEPADKKKKKGSKSAVPREESAKPTEEKKKEEKKDEKLQPLLIKSDYEKEEERALHVIEALADLILDVMMFAEKETCAEEIKVLKFQRYNYDFVQKYVKK